MSESVVMHPAAPAVEGSTHGGFAEIARQINARHPERSLPISRQLVSRWYACRGVNGFPEREPVDVGGHKKLLFNLDAVVKWHAWWLRKRQEEGHVPQPVPGMRRPSAEAPEYDPALGTIPLFDVNRYGHPVDNESSRGGHPGVRESNYRSSVLDL